MNIRNPKRSFRGPDKSARPVRSDQSAGSKHREATTNSKAFASKSSRRGVRFSKHTRGFETNVKLPYVPPEDWHEPAETPGQPFQIVEQSPGKGFRHILTPREIRSRLSQLPDRFVEPLEVVQLSRMTRKKRSFPCYGMQWGASLYLYPLEESLVEYFTSAPRPEVFNECQMFGGQWRQGEGTSWDLVWTEAAIKDFYLNNVLIHELGHLLDDRNSNYNDRERFADWFAIEHGYRPSRRRSSCGNGRRRRKQVRRRHHSR